MSPRDTLTNFARRSSSLMATGSRAPQGQRRARGAAMMLPKAIEVLLACAVADHQLKIDHPNPAPTASCSVRSAATAIPPPVRCSS